MELARAIRDKVAEILHADGLTTSNSKPVSLQWGAKPRPNTSLNLSIYDGHFLFIILFYEDHCRLRPPAKQCLSLSYSDPNLFEIIRESANRGHRQELTEQ